MFQVGPLGPHLVTGGAGELVCPVGLGQSYCNQVSYRHSSIYCVHPIKSCLNMNLSPTRTHVSHRHLQIRSAHPGQLKQHNDNFIPTRSLSHLRTPNASRTPTTRIPTSTNIPTQCRMSTMTRRAWITPRCNLCPFQDSECPQDSYSNQDSQSKWTKVAKNYPTRFLHILMHQMTA